MKNIDNLEPIPAIIFDNEEGQRLILMVGQDVEIITDETDFDKKVNGCINFVNEDGIEVDNDSEYSELIHWEYVKEINIIKEREEV